MNRTNRAANRLLLAIVGVLLLAAAATSVLLLVLPAFADGWGRGFFGFAQQGPSWLVQPVVGEVGWLAIFVALAALVLAVLLVVFVVRQGGGHAASVLERRPTEYGRTRIDLAVPRSLLADHLAEQPDVLASRVTAYDVQGTPTLKVSVRARRGVSPKAVADDVLAALHALDALLGEEIPALVQISGGFRARTAPRARLT